MQQQQGNKHSCFSCCPFVAAAINQKKVLDETALLYLLINNTIDSFIKANKQTKRISLYRRLMMFCVFRVVKGDVKQEAVSIVVLFMRDVIF